MKLLKMATAECATSAPSTTECSSEEKRKQFGNRFLTDPSQVYKHNAWDNVEWDKDQEDAALVKISENSKELVPKEEREKLEVEAHSFWDKFYLQHQERFFKDRHWLFTEFEELAPKSNNGHGSPGLVQINGREANELNFPGQNAHTRFFEVGCGVGNTVFPVLQANSDGGIFVYCCDFAQSAVDLVKQHPDYDNKRCHAFLCDVAAENPQFPFPKESLDVIVLIFVLSAIAPNKMQRVINNLSELLKPGGKILFRDYGRFDMAQLRFKKGRCLEENFYVRGDGTRVYFFTQDELSSMFKTAGLIEEQNHVDRRLQVNRGKQLKMYRIWIQCKYRKANP
ncbi:tRNA N(3)-methylcytidine methyltransferase METTL2-like [Rhopilema esculentum]|uniref:tRNA N(3)-methylcytidine methyltransferase METTL2-like n=1 Tax=Rhopilema esculentum TaxID=499914 RepID=UPI0031DE97A8